MAIKIAGIIGGVDPDLRAARQIHPVLALEEEALRRWLNGDPEGFLEICSDDVVYFDPFTETRIHGKLALTEYYNAIRGKIHAASYEILDPIAQQVGSTVMLAYNFVSYGGNEDAFRWNCTEVYTDIANEWRIIQTHWSFTKRT